MKSLIGDTVLFKNIESNNTSSIHLKNIKNKRVIILARKGERCIRVKDGTTLIDGRGFSNRFYLTLSKCESCVIEIIPTNLKKNRVYIEPITSNRLRNILNKKFRRVNN